MTRTAIIAALLATLLGCSRSTSSPHPDNDGPAIAADAGAADTFHPELEFFNSLTGRLEIELTLPAEKVGDLAVLRAPNEAKIKSLKLNAEVFNPDTEKTRELTDAERQSVAFRAPQIKLRGDVGNAIPHRAPNGEFFTVDQLLEAIVDTERHIRPQSDWEGGVDIHHIFFEGIHHAGNGVWEIYWGS